MAQDPEKIRCDACPVMCYVAPGQTGACDRYANHDGRIVRCDPITILSKTLEEGGRIVPFATPAWDGEILHPADAFVTGIGAGTTYPDYKPAPFIVSSRIEGADMVTVVTEAIFSYCGVKVKIDTDRFLGPEGALVRASGEPVGHVTTAEYGSQMLSLGGVHHLTGGTKAEGRVTCATLLSLCNAEAVTLTIDGGAQVIVQAGRAPIVDGKQEHRMRVGCGSATIGMFAAQWTGLVDEVVVVDDHITGVVSEHQAGKVLDWQPRLGSRSRATNPPPAVISASRTPGSAGAARGSPTRSTSSDRGRHKRGARPGLTLLMVSTTGEEHAYLRPERSPRNPSAKPLPGAICRRPSGLSTKIANPRSAPSCSWGARADRSGRASRKTPSA